MHVVIVESPEEDPESLDPEPSDNIDFRETECFSHVKFKSGEVVVCILERSWVDIFNLIDMFELSSIIETAIKSSSHPFSLPDKKTTIAIVATDDAHMRQLNNEFRNKPLPTNILSFPDRSIEQNQEEYHLGDIFLGYEIINKEAAAQDIPIRNHVLHLIVHGTLHLLGYDHECEHQAQIMERKESAILDIFNIPDPYLL